MTAPEQPDRQRRRLRPIVITIAAVGAVLIAGVGTAAAGDRGWWGKKHRPRPAVSATPSPSPVGASSSPAQAAETSGSVAPAPATPTGSSAADTGATGIARPPANAGFDYQISQAYTPPTGVEIVSRDHSESPATGKYNICYVNGFQAQPEEASDWQANHDDLLLKQGGSYVVDGDWDEILLDISTSAKRAALTEIMGVWIDQCATKGFQAVEVDNLDSWTRSNDLLTQADAVAYAGLLVTRVHGAGLAIGQKNTVEIASIGRSQIGFDFAIAESCVQYEITDGVPECQGYIDAYGAYVILIEYDGSHFQQACSRYGETLSIVQRDRDVTAPGSSTYVFESC
ncbi:MAG: hypothetical protein HKP61_00735 [Dactylosporangium sp.]|nr:endo alpha-1,4 polygalactosaminidase [Dactylosporangium sp.]NNJ59495.1 hypothetical protein [Dactylosporangium sp.]